jgi:predicted oxidoreductase
MTVQRQSDVLVIGGGLAGIVTALEALRAGQSVTIVDRDTPERFGGLALWAFGGMALVGTPLQARMKIPDTPEVALRDWLRFGELPATDTGANTQDHTHAIAWARHYVEQSRPQVYDWLLAEGLKFMPRSQLGGARHEWRWQQPAALPHRLGHSPRAGALPGGRAAPCQHRGGG